MSMKVKNPRNIVQTKIPPPTGAPCLEIPVLVIHSFVGYALQNACARQATLFQEGRKGLSLWF